MYSRVIIIATAAVALGLSLTAHATGPRAACPGFSWMSDPSRVPACPAGDNTKLPENFPSMAYVVSDVAQSDFFRSGADFTADFVHRVLEASGDQVPLLIMPVSDDTFQYVSSQLEDWARAQAHGNRREAARLLTQWRAALHQVSAANPFTWQQDYFESFIDTRTGNPVLRPIRGYSEARNDGFEPGFDALSTAATGSCSLLSRGESLPPESETGYHAESGHSGGNIEALPGGLCLHGDTQAWNDYVRHYCGDRSNEVEISTSWLAVGHADEISAVVHAPGRPPCDFAVSLASPRKAIELLNQHRFDPFLRFTGPAARDRVGSAWTLDSLHEVCVAVISERLRARGATKPTAPSGGSGGMTPATWLERLRDGLQLEPEAYAGVRLVRSTLLQQAEDICAHPESLHPAITNGEVADVLTGTGPMAILNQLIEQKMSEARALILRRLHERLPQCDPPRILDLPQVFAGGQPVAIRGADPSAPLKQRYRLPKETVVSILPNATNALSVRNTVITPDPHNAAFAQYTAAAYRAAGVHPSFMETFEYAHVGDGNLHCSSHAIPFCRPEGR